MVKQFRTPVSRKELDEILGALQADVTSSVTAAVAQSCTAAIRKIALNAVERTGDNNKYRIVVRKPFFEEWRQQTKTDFGTRQQMGA